MKNSTEIIANWNDLKWTLKQRFDILTDYDLILIEGHHDDMVARIQMKLGKSKEQVHSLLDGL